MLTVRDSPRLWRIAIDDFLSAEILSEVCNFLADELRSGIIG
jgi:hypothetical protein